MAAAGTIGFIGAGNMAGAIVHGVVEADIVDGSDVHLYDASVSVAQSLAQQTGARVTNSAKALVEACEVVVLAVKPQVLPVVLAEIADDVAQHRPLVVSIAAGTTLAALGAKLGEARLVRVMPNVNALVGAGMAAVCANAAATEDDVARVEEIFAAVGDVVHLAEKDFAAYTAIAGSSPAFVFTFIDALARGAVRDGLPKALSVQIAAQAVLGSARMVLERAEAGATPADLTDTVCSPGGTTIAGLVAMEEAGFSSAVVRGVRAVVDRHHELGA